MHGFGVDIDVDIAIVVNVGTPLKQRSEITSALAIIEQYSNKVGQQNVSRQLDSIALSSTSIAVVPAPEAPLPQEINDLMRHLAREQAAEMGDAQDDLIGR